MGSATHIQGVPQRPGQASRRDTRSVMERDRERTADIRPVIYLRPLGRGQHLVLNQCNAQPYRVASLNPSVTFSPGSQVPAGSFTAHPGEFIMGEPPIGRKGGSLGATYSIRVAPFTLTEDPPPAPPVLDNQMMGFFGTGSDLHCWEYDDAGLYVGDVATATMAASVPVTGIVLRQRIVHDEAGSGLGTPILMYNTSSSTTGTSGLRAIVVWDLANNQVYLITPTMPGGTSNWSVGPPFVPPGESGGYLYFLAHDDSTGNIRTRLWRAKMDGSAPAAMWCDVTADTNGHAQGTVLFDDTYAYGTDIVSTNVTRFPLAGGSVTPYAYGQASSPSLGIVAYHADLTAGVNTWFGTSSRRQKRIVGDPGVTFKLSGANALTLDAPNTSTTNRGPSVNRAVDTSIYFPWSTGTLNQGKLAQPNGTTASSGHSTSSPLITFDPHPTHGLPQFVHLNQFAYAW